jgi:bifunctional non-homologous end joining protein LigD
VPRVALVKSRSATPAALPDFVEPMKAKLVASTPAGNWIYEVKFDGYRALALRSGSETELLSRNQKNLGKKFPEIVDSIGSLDVQDAIVDGEVVALNGSRAVILSGIARFRYGPREAAYHFLRV